MKIMHAELDADGGKNSEIFRTPLRIEDVENDSDTALAVDTWARAFVNLSSDEYRGVEFTATANLTEIITEQEEG